MKRYLSFILILFITIIPLTAYGKYGGISTRFYYDSGWAGAKYCGTTKNLTIDEVHNDRWCSVVYNNTLSSPESLSGKLSKQQSQLLWDALKQYDYEPGEIYAVNFTEIQAPRKYYALTVQIENDGSCSWKGFTYYY